MSRSARIFATVLALLCGAPSHAAVERRLEIAGDRQVAWSAAIDDGERFDLEFEHSQERTLWTQHYEAGADGAIWQVGSTFGSYGAGMPMAAVRRTRAGLRAEGHSRLGSIPMRSWHASRMRLVHRGRAVRVDQWFDDYEPFEIRIR